MYSLEKKHASVLNHLSGLDGLGRFKQMFLNLEGELHPDVLLFIEELLQYQSTALESEKEIYLSLAERTTDLIARFNRDLEVVFLNSKAKEFMGPSKPGVIGIRRLILDLGLNPGTASFISRVFASGEPVEGETVLSKDGQKKIMDFRFFPERNKVGEVHSVLCLLRDVTPRKLAEKEAFRYSKRSAALLQLTRDGIHVMNAKGELLLANKALREMLGYSHRELMNTQVFNWDLYFSPGSLLELFKRLRQEPSKYETRLQRRDNSFIDVEVSTRPVEFDEQVAILCSSRDISERKALEREMFIARARIEESEKLKTAFLDNLSHEIRTPMNSIMGFSEMLERNTGKERQAQFTGIIRQQCRDLLRIIDDIVEMSKLHTGQVILDEQVVEPVSIWKELAEYAKEYLSGRDNKRVKLVFPRRNYSGGFLCDKHRLVHVLTKLLDNALKFTNKGTIRVRFSLESDEAFFAIQDTGIGIARERQEVIFQRFRQLDDNSSRGYGGNGLGLALCKEYIDLMNGRIWVDSTLGKGSVFSFRVPVKRLETKMVN